MPWYDCLQRMMLSLLSPSTPPWPIEKWNCSPMVLFGILGCPRELVSLLGKQLGPRSLL